MNIIEIEDLKLSYNNVNILNNIDVEFIKHKSTVILGPNGCGKSTLLKGIARLLPYQKGAIVLDGKDINKLSTKSVAQKMGLMMQSSSVPGGITVYDLVSRGRYPHGSFFTSLTTQDKIIINTALVDSGIIDLKDSVVDELSGGQKQRVWLAMALAQDTEVLILDEPTTYLDVRHKKDIIDLITKLKLRGDRSIISVLHDINDAITVSDNIIVIKDGSIGLKGGYKDLLNRDLLKQIYSVDCHILSGKNYKNVIVPSSLISPELSINEHNKSSFDISNLSFKYDKSYILKNVSTKISKGEINTILGENGSGKSTLLKIIGRHLSPENGNIKIDGTEINAVKPKSFAKKVAFFSQTESFPVGITVKEYVEMGRFPYLTFWGKLREWDHRAVDKALKDSGVYNMKDRLVSTLSGGEAQRVRIARVLAQESEIILLDEPTSFMDISKQVELLDLVWSINRRRGVTIVMVLHDLWQAYRYSDNLIFLKDGDVIETGKVEHMAKTDLVDSVFNIKSEFVPDPVTGRQLVLV